ncbi:MAG: tRNA pseudouridine(55) synthase TruB [Desulfovibrionaceae bacterium]|nr:tRNA pseudouridine(55) synthase TruB [Desulfovibrionaceae bacterium]
MQEDGVLVLNKPSGMTSNACLQHIKRKCGQKKIGHAGTLDPMVDGVLLVLLGQGTKISSYLMECGTKIYKGTLQIGYETTTWDKEGEIKAKYPVQHVTPSMIEEEIASWISVTEQEVPPISAAKLHGKSLYKWTRMGYDVPCRFKKVCISSVEILSVEPPYATFRVECSSGTYIRSLAHSLGKRLQCGAVLHSLTREYSHPFSLEESIDFNTLLSGEKELSCYVKPITQALPHFLSLDVSDIQAQELQCGKRIRIKNDVADTSYAIALYQEKAIALLQADIATQEWKIIRGLF